MQGDDGWCLTDHSLRLRGARPGVRPRKSRGEKKVDEGDSVITIGKGKGMDAGEVGIAR